MDGALKLTTKVAGVTYEGRQSILARIQRDTPVRLRPEPTNQYDANAVAVDVALGGKVSQAGYVPAQLAKLLAPYMEGESLMASVVEVTGGFETYDGDIAALGLRILIELPAPESAELVNALRGAANSANYR